MNLKTEYRKARILDFDIEARPTSWYAGDMTTKQPTAIAWKFIGGRSGVEVAAIGESFDTRLVYDEEIAMLTAFQDAYDQADMVTGHYIRNFDLPLINGRLMKHGLKGLRPKLTQDTQRDLQRRHGLSGSQENLAAMWELRHPKVGMNTAKWENANILLPEGIEQAKKRVVGDVRQHIEMRAEMVRLDILKPPRIWRP